MALLGKWWQWDMDADLWLEQSSVMSPSQEGQAGFGEVLLEGISSTLPADEPGSTTVEYS